MPSEGIWASTFNREILEKIGDAIAEDAHLNDIQSMWAPGINLHRAPFVGRTNEYFSEDPFLTGVSAECEVIGMQKKGIIAHLKHFAFNDEETDRNGISIWLNEQEARELLLYPFERAVYKGQAHAIMSSFNRIGPIWAGADKDAQISVLRDEWGFEGFLLTDMAEGNGKQYMTYQDGIIGGTNIFLGNGGEKFLDDWKDNAAYANAVRDSAHRIAYNILNYSAAMDGIAGKVQYVAPWWQNLLTGVSIGTGVIAFIALGLSLASLFLTLKKKS